MKGLGTTAVSAAAIILSGASMAYAADMSMPVKAVPVSGPSMCMSIMDFFTTACQVSAYGVRFYGTVDVGGGYQTAGTPMDPHIGADPYLGKPSRGAMFVASPNNLSVSNVGLQINERIGGDWAFVAQVEAGFNPYSGDLLDAPKSLRSGIGVPLAQQTAITDANFNGQFYNDLGYFGFSHPIWGTLTFGRQNSLGADQVLAYDPQQSAGAFSVLGLIGSYAGGGNTENRRDTTALKYRVNIANWHLGLYAQVGGFEQGNDSTGAYYANVGSDFHIGPGLFSWDAVGGTRRNSIGEGPGGITGPVNSDGSPFQPFTDGVDEAIGATLNNTTQFMLTGKYTVDRLKLYAGWDYMRFSSPDDPNIALEGVPSDISGLALAGSGAGGVIAPGSSINATLFNGRVLQNAWVGFRYALTDSLDLSGAYYHVWQNDFSNGAKETFSTAPGQSIPQRLALGQAVTCAASPRISIQCSGTQNEVSLVLDWKFAPKWDTYIGTNFVHGAGGLNSGYLEQTNISTTAGLRFRW